MSKKVPDAEEKTLLHYLGLALSGAVLLLVIGLGLLVIVIPKVAGGIPLTVLTSSMIPHFPPGSLIVVVPVDANELRIGDVASYQITSGKPGVITHRIISIQSASNGTRMFAFKGDNNSDRDRGLVLAAQVKGRVWYSLPYIGYVNNAVNGKNKSWIVPGLAALLLAYAAYTVISSIVSSLRSRRRTASQRSAESGDPVEQPEAEQR